LVDIGYLQQLSTYRVWTGAPKSAGSGSVDMSTIHLKNAIGTRDAPQNLHGSCRSGDDDEYFVAFRDLNIH
jgi:hypothetical protein